jgi:hypothetical protein
MMAVRAVHGRSNITNTSDGIGGEGRKSVDLAQQFIEVFVARRERPDTLNRGRAVLVKGDGYFYFLNGERRTGLTVPYGCPRSTASPWSSGSSATGF